MTVGFDPSSINITVHADGVKPIISTISAPITLGGNTFAGGFVKLELSHAKAKKKRLEAFQMDSRVKFTMGPGDTLDDWKVGFVQIARQNTLKTVYAGRFRSEGSIICDALPKLSNSVLLDSLAITIVPFYEPPDDKFAFKGSEARPSTGDGPTLSVPLSLANGAVSSVDNFLFSVQDDREFWTILTAADPTKTLQYLAHVHWRVAHAVGVVWRGGAPLPTAGASKVKFDQFVLGPPIDPTLAKILSSPTGPLADDVFVPAFNNSLISGPNKDPVIHQEFAEWPFGLPAFFWQ
jgi:hypothetical protein